jgi:hypothetical protein
VVAGAVAAVIVLSNGGGPGQPSHRGIVDFGAAQTAQGTRNASTYNAQLSLTPSTTPSATPVTRGRLPATGGAGSHTLERADAGAPSTASGAANYNPQSTSSNATAGVLALSAAPVAPGARQIQSAQISLTTPNVHVDQVAQEVFDVVGQEHGTVQSSHITAATRGTGGGYAAFSLSIPTANLQATMTDLSRLHFAAVQSRTDSSQNVSHQYNFDQRRLADAQALRASLLKQLQTAYTTQAIDSIKAQLKLAEQQITSWQATLGSLQHRIGYSNVEVGINQGGLPIPVRPTHHSSGFTIGGAGHDALRVLVVSAGVALIALAVMVPVGLVAALLIWLWVWLRQRRREHALDATT